MREPEISFGLTIFRVSFCTCDKFFIDSVSFLVHISMFECVCFKWCNKPVVSAYLLNSWWQCVRSAFVSLFSWKCSQTELLHLLPLHDIFCTSSCYHDFTLTITHYHSTLFLKIFNIYEIRTDFEIYVWTSRVSQQYCSTAYIMSKY